MHQRNKTISTKDVNTPSVIMHISKVLMIKIVLDIQNVHFSMTNVFAIDCCEINITSFSGFENILSE